MKRIAMFLAFFALGLHLLLAQTVQITGTVTSSEDGQPLPGASVLVKGTTIGVTTDFNGKYTISVPADAQTLVISFVGMQDQEVAIAGKTVIDVKLEAGAVLEEVVVTAIGITKLQRNLGYSATQVKSDELTKTGSTSLVNSLQGKVAGVNISSASGAPGASTKIVVRGYTSLSGSNQPLIVIDGIPASNFAITDDDLNGGLDFGNGLNDVNPEDIESVTVLKGSNATVLYGSRASNGAIEIKTKKGKNTGATPEIVFASTTTFERPLRLPLYQNNYGQGFFGEPDLIENTSWGPKLDGKMRLWGNVVDNSQQLKPYKAQENNVKDFFDIGKTYNNTISISNGNEQYTYYISYGNVSADGILSTDADSYKRNTLTFNGSAKFRKLTTSASVTYISKKSSFVPTGQDQSVIDNIMQVPRDMSIVDGEDYNNKFWNLDNYYSGYTLNPYYVLNEHGNNMNEDRVYGNIKLDYSLFKALNAKWEIGTDVSNSQLKQWRAITNPVRNDYNDDVGRVSDETFYNNQITSNFYLTFSKALTNTIELNVLAGHSLNQREYKSTFARVIGLDIPNFYHLSNSSAQPSVNYDSYKRRIMGALGSIDINYKKIININMTGRNDWSSTLPESNRSYFYPGINSSIVFSEILPKNTVLTFGKLRLGWARTGNDAGPYLIKSVFVPAEHYDGYRYLTYPLPGQINGFESSNRIGNPELSPEFSDEFEIGTELRFIGGRIYLDLAYYNKTVTDLIWDANISSTSGFTTQTMNLGKITNKGIEVMLNLVPLKTQSLTWDITLTYTKNDNEIVELNEELPQIDIGGTGRLPYVAKPGYPIGLFLGDGPAITADGKTVVDANGVPVASTEPIIYGTGQIDWNAGLVNNFTFRNLTFSFTFDTKQGGLMYSRTAEMMHFAGTDPNTLFNDRQPFIVPNSVVQIGTETNGDPIYAENTTPITYSSNLHNYWGQAAGGGLFQRRFVINRSFVKLREVAIGYSIPRKIFQNTFIKGLELRLVGRNLILWTPEDNHYIDPESTTFGNNIEGDYGEFSATPSTRSLGATVRIRF